MLQFNTAGQGTLTVCSLENLGCSYCAEAVIITVGSKVVSLHVHPPADVMSSSKAARKRTSITKCGLSAGSDANELAAAYRILNSY